MITLKPQWRLRELIPDRWSLTSEDAHFPVSLVQGTVLQKLVSGVDIADLTDDEFKIVQHFSDRGFLDQSHNKDAPFWELSGVNYHSLQEQLRHVKVAIIDLTPNSVGDSVLDTLIKSDVLIVTPEEATVTLMFADTFHELIESPGTVLPIICNRVKITMGPLIFEWGPHIKDQVAQSQTFMQSVDYTLPLAADLLQRAWISVQVLNFVGATRLKFAGHFVEYNLAKQEFNLWPAWK